MNGSGGNTTSRECALRGPASSLRDTLATAWVSARVVKDL